MDENLIQDRGVAGTARQARPHSAARHESRETIVGGVARPEPHDSGARHVAGEARYIDDMAELPGTLHIYVAMSDRAHAEIKAMDLEKVRAAHGVACVLTASDIPGENDASPVFGDDPVFADRNVEYHGQSIFAVAAETLALARQAADRAEIVYEDCDAVITLDEALKAGSDLLPPHEMRLGDCEGALAKAPHKVSGRVRIGGQDHFYLEGQIAYALPGEDGDIVVHSSTQHPSEVQHNVAKVLGLSDHAVTIEVRRMGGGFGGKESQPALFAAIAALVAAKTGRPAKCRLDRDDDMVMTGKRHDFLIDYEVGFDGEGRIAGAAFDQAMRCGYSADLSGAIADRAMFHADNAYALNAARIRSRRMKTHTVSNTAFRGFGGPQGMVATERMIEKVAFALGKDPLDIRKANFYPAAGGALTPYHMEVTDSVIAEMVEELEKSSDYRTRREAVRAFNQASPVVKKGLALTPVKFGISFTTRHLNQAGALVHVYKDGSVMLNHGGTEMGQGLFVKVAQVVAEEFQIDLARVKITSTRTDKVPNTSATAASSGSDINGMAAQAAARTIKERLIAFAAEAYGVSREKIVFRPNRVQIGDEEMSFAELVEEAYLARISLSATGFYATPGITYDRETATGHPFLYFAYGAACSEVAIDTLTGENKVLRVDILHEVGRSLNPAVDMGQIEGGFIQGMGWLTTEELCWNGKGELTTHAPSTYKIPTANDRPDDMRIKIWEKGESQAETIYRSKAVGEPPLMLAISVFSALADAVSAASDYKVFPDLDAPATPERILFAVEDVRRQAAGKTAA
ncbi:xanthine dehydrogenase molybdopterin binding subunit [Afifella marina]|uniref:Xanthine dehydrogenase, molybdenum binding subunit apoprotein n=1 Tax=Afifella marina DSM 2698 TaxID=1120955 RepID=A0A1G5M6E0_AFIMA|nr:xanthine dehydrogenase molybdopterin binding subunit [Afifella marina]MBK1622911.1 xanthine dehydrogenase molybdopterin binding subunit [Afifella marina DSM 2698]MBK1625906.1 xanthine dehydrogenase molybdopterin binding subunit [Afifella marina]MBK5917728.1 xanthine dehydrogenase molybdopterin binding subunit [Afifella marina]RAI23645.1 xanthine dehydrogenase molybdopterin binding subunit [Afifella marina DSM 2698]SCZ20735.1 xanthine dehydrogenase, molybdenum binding subunit apoprotein [Afi